MTDPAPKPVRLLSALKTGLTGRTVLLPSEAAAVYEAISPNSANKNWLSSSASPIPTGVFPPNSLPRGRIYALGRLKFAELFPEQEEGIRKQLIEAKIYLAYQLQLANLSIQEGRLRRQTEKDLAALQDAA